MAAKLPKGVQMGWGGSCRGRVSHAEVELVVYGWVGHAGLGWVDTGVGWVMQGWGE